MTDKPTSDPKFAPTPGSSAYLSSTGRDLEVTVMSVDGAMATIWVPRTGQMLEAPLSVLRW